MIRGCDCSPQKLRAGKILGRVTLLHCDRLKSGSYFLVWEWR